MDDAKLHSAARTQDFLTKTGAEIVRHSPYSPALNMFDRFLFTRLQEHCREIEYADGDELYLDVQRFFWRLPQNLLKRELSKLLQHCRDVIEHQGDYVV